MGRDYQLAKKLCQMSKYKTLTFSGIPLFLETDPTITKPSQSSELSANVSGIP